MVLVSWLIELLSCLENVFGLSLEGTAVLKDSKSVFIWQYAYYVVKSNVQKKMRK